MNLITAATGQVGSAALNSLVATGAEVRALVRRSSGLPSPKVSRLCRAAPTMTSRSPERSRAFDVMLLAGRDSPHSVSQHQRVLAHACRAGVRHIVKLSAIGASSQFSNSVDARASRNRRRNPRKSGRLDAQSRTSICRTCCARRCGSTRGPAFSSDGARPFSPRRRQRCRHRCSGRSGESHRIRRKRVHADRACHPQLRRGRVCVSCCCRPCDCL